jgi:hypothetical protein
MSVATTGQVEIAHHHRAAPRRQRHLDLDRPTTVVAPRRRSPGVGDPVLDGCRGALSDNCSGSAVVVAVVPGPVAHLRVPSVASTTSVNGGLGAHHREEDHVADGLDLGKQHHQAVDTDPDPRCRRKAVLEGPDEGHIGRVGLEIAAGHRLGLAPEAFLLLLGDVELAVAVGELLGIDASSNRSASVGSSRSAGPAARPRRESRHTKTGSTTVGQQDGVVELEDQLSRAPLGQELDAVLGADRTNRINRVARVEPAADHLFEPVEQRSPRPWRA